MSFFAFVVAGSLSAFAQAAGPAPAVSSMLRGSAGKYWLLVSGPSMAPPAVAKLDVDAIQRAAPSGGWNSGNSNLFSFRNGDGDVGIVTINPDFCGRDVTCVVPDGSVSTDGKFYVGPYQTLGEDELFFEGLVVYDKAPELGPRSYYIPPAGEVGQLRLTKAPLDSQSITFNTATNQWQSTVLPFTVVQDRDRAFRLHYGELKSFREPSPQAGTSVAYQVTFYNNPSVQVSILRYQKMQQWWAVADSCSDFEAVRSHLGGMDSCQCSQWGSAKYGCPFQAWTSWQ